MTKYVVGIDWNTNTGKGLEYVKIEAENLTDAMVTADQLKTKDVYLVSLMKKAGKIEKAEYGKRTTYEAIYTRRTHWHSQDDGEQPWRVYHYTNKYGEWFETL